MTAASGTAAPEDVRFLGQPTEQHQPSPDPPCSPQPAMVGGQPPRIKDACGAARGGRASGPVLDPERPPARFGSYAGKQDQRGQYPAPVNRLSDRETTGLSGLDTGPLLGMTGPARKARN